MEDVFCWSGRSTGAGGVGGEAMRDHLGSNRSIERESLASTSLDRSPDKTRTGLGLPGAIPEIFSISLFSVISFIIENYFLSVRRKCEKF